MTHHLALTAACPILSPSSSENCVSTSAVNIPGKLGSPWEYALQTDDADRAFASLVQAVEASSDATMKMIDTKGLYLLAEFPSKERKMRYSINYSARILPYSSDCLGLNTYTASTKEKIIMACRNLSYYPTVGCYI